MKYVFALLLYFYSMVAMADSQLLGMRIQDDKDQTRIILIFARPVTYKIYSLTKPDRLVLELKNVSSQIELTPMTLNNLQIKLIRSIKHNKDVQLVFETTGTPKWKLKFLPFSTTEGVRLQLDIQTEKKSVQSKALDPALKAARDDTENMSSRAAFSAGSSASIKSKEKTIFTVVIDPGHGGKDPGAVGSDGTQEKTVVLNIARQLAKFLNQQPYMHAVLTRDKDYFIPLRSRLDIARKNKADFFIAVHADAYFNNDAYGASVYALSQHGATTEAARWLAQRENYSELGDVELKSLHDQSRLLRSVLIDLAQTATINESVQLGNSVLDALEPISALHYHRVEQAPFVVLKSPDIPSILVETGFISNPKEARRLSTHEYQIKIAQALVHGVNQYLSASTNHKFKMTASYYGTADSEINTLIS